MRLLRQAHLRRRRHHLPRLSRLVSLQIGSPGSPARFVRGTHHWHGLATLFVILPCAMLVSIWANAGQPFFEVLIKVFAAAAWVSAHFDLASACIVRRQYRRHDLPRQRT